MVRNMAAALLLLLVGAAVSAQEFQNIGAEELKKLTDSKSKVVVVDARPAQEYVQGHIPGSINIAPEQYEAIGSILTADKKTTLVFYCRGVG